ncbi:MAG: hypothetical protein GEU98_23565 [Pseudonocardiaceae bacterium]|nr:hypothetical protein [Pseudonocardiaceae bacterium]
MATVVGLILLRTAPEPSTWEKWHIAIMIGLTVLLVVVGGISTWYVRKQANDARSQRTSAEQAARKAEDALAHTMRPVFHVAAGQSESLSLRHADGEATLQISQTGTYDATDLIVDARSLDGKQLIASGESRELGRLAGRHPTSTTTLDRWTVHLQNLDPLTAEGDSHEFTVTIRSHDDRHENSQRWEQRFRVKRTVGWYGNFGNGPSYELQVEVTSSEPRKIAADSKS